MRTASDHSLDASLGPAIGAVWWRLDGRDPTTSLLRLALTGMLAITAACGDASGGGSASLSLPTIAVDTMPALLLADDGTPEKLFSRVTARRLASGEIIVADQGTVSIRVFGRDGRLLRTLARQGPGPGELPAGFVLTMCQDTLVAIGQPPFAPSGVHIFVAGAGDVRSFRPRVEGEGLITAFDCLDGGRLLVRRGGNFRPLARPPDVNALTPDTVTYGILSTDPAKVAWLPPAITQWYVGYPWPNGPMPSAMAPHPFVPATLVVSSGDRVWFVDTGTGTLQAFDTSGTVVVTQQLTVPRQPFDSDALERRLARALREAQRAVDTARQTAIHASRFLPATMPIASAAYAAEGGGLWLRVFNLDDEAQQRFIVIGPDGVAIGTTVLPARFDVHQIGRDFVLGVRRDESGVESVVEFTLAPPAGR